MSYKIGTIQAQDIQGDIPAALKVISDAMHEADSQQIDILCFPECFLQGYTLNVAETKARAISTGSQAFQDVLNRLVKHKVTIILGMIERGSKGIYNTAAVIRQGKLLGTYRKVHLFEQNFRPGEEYPVFTIEGLTFGINICYDARFSEGALELAQQDAEVIFYPLNNRLSIEKANKYKDKHILNLIDRAKEAKCWVVSSDVIRQDSESIGYGCSVIVNPDGEMIGQVKELESGMITYQVL